jgi:glutamine synthetase adenylyltransferase
MAISTAVEHLERRLAVEFGEPVGKTSGRKQKFHVVGMGKLGGNELNVSSDIDLVFVYPEEGEIPGARPLSNHEYFARFARRLIAMLNEMTADGYVFRVDVRLRPLGTDGPLACSFDMLENYFVTQGSAWERYAWIKARVICGDRAHELSEMVRPFVFRRHLDFSAFDSLRDLHREVRREVERRDILDNINFERHPRNRIHRADVPVDPRRTRCRLRYTPTPSSAARSAQSASAHCGTELNRCLCISAQSRTPAAISGRQANQRLPTRATTRR